MSDLIHLLPDSVANQIAAGEVIQRPASSVKELVENAIDCGSTVIKIIIKDAGRTLVQVIDNGCGMSETDARMAFERHATSKISKADDLFAIKTMGFRGEALASMGAVAQVELKTRRQEDELGTRLCINGSKVETQEPVSCPAGSNFAIKNLFYNIPARRKFLKSNQTELKHIIVELQRVALSHPDIQFIMHHNGSEIYHLVPGNLRQRIVGVFSRSIEQNLIPLNTETSVVKISGFIGKPENAKKTFGEQFFFINKRYMRHPYFHRAVMDAYEGILPPETFPSYFIYMSADPHTIDINIHPTKTEIKFEDERSCWQILHASIKEALGKFNIIPSLDFDTRGSIDIPLRKKDGSFFPPPIKTDPSFNPFEKDEKGFGGTQIGNFKGKQDVRNW
ncbi:MAG: DNA mismatch repair endonuclease MutL, partial [Bacteroidales bacterium]|nr:DNA mismatch repair endonuclease MutL [Bacteroidales bacterium]